MNNYLISIVIPVYNVEKYLDECVQSVLAQSYENFELILVNDGSKDGSGAICDKYAQMDPRVQAIHKANGGMSDARNVGTQQAKGQYIVYIDSDDYFCDKGFLKKINEKANCGYDVICYKFKKYFEAQKTFGECTFSCPDIDKIDSLAGRMKEIVSRDAFYCSAWSKAIRLDIIKENGIQFEKGLLAEDQEWYYHVLMKVRSITYIDEAVLVYRQRSKSVTSTFGVRNLIDCIDVVNRWYKRIGQENIDEEYKAALLSSVAKLYCNFLIAYAGLDGSEKKQHLAKIRQMQGLLKHRLNPRTNAFYKLYRVAGFDGLMLALTIVCRLRKRKR